MHRPPPLFSRHSLPRRRDPRLPLIALMPLIILAVCITYVGAGSLITHADMGDSCITDPLTLPSITLPSPIFPDTPPVLLLSASDLPPTAPDVYDILYAADPPTPSPPALPLPDGCAPILRKNLAYSLPNTMYLSNQSIYSPDTNRLTEMEWAGTRPVSLGNASEPTVLIYHTHTTEAFLAEDAAYVTENETFRSTDETENIVAVGRVVADALRNAGIGVVHCTTVHDQPSYNHAYSEARKSVEAMLAEYPSIRYILDIHRDALITSDGAHIRPITLAPDGSESAQVMLVIGTGQDGDHPSWETNLSLACKLQIALNDAVPDLARPINLRASSFLAEYADGAMLVEIGSAANTLTQAKTAARLFAREFADLVWAMGTAA